MISEQDGVRPCFTIKCRTVTCTLLTLRRCLYRYDFRLGEVNHIPAQLNIIINSFVSITKGCATTSVFHHFSAAVPRHLPEVGLVKLLQFLFIGLPMQVTRQVSHVGSTVQELFSKMFLISYFV